MSRCIKSAALLAALALSAPVAMADKAALPQTVVSYSDLNLETRDGMNTLFKRIERASKKVCGKRPTTVMNLALTRYYACRGATASDAVRSMNSPSVSLAWAARTGEIIQTASR